MEFLNFDFYDIEDLKKVVGEPEKEGEKLIWKLTYRGIPVKMECDNSKARYATRVKIFARENILEDLSMFLHNKIIKL